MNLSPELILLQENEQNYYSNDQVRSVLGRKVISMIIGPTAVGKSTIIHEMLSIKPEWSVAGTITTRRRRNDDPDNYFTEAEGITNQDLIGRINSGDLINYSVHPGGDIYAYSPDSFGTKYNLAPLTTPSIETMKTAGFERAETSFIYAKPEDWEFFLKDRLSDPKIAARLEESATSLRYGLDNAKSLHIIENTIGSEGLRKSAQKVIEITMGYAKIERDKDYNILAMEESLNFIKQIRRGL